MDVLAWFAYVFVLEKNLKLFWHFRASLCASLRVGLHRYESPRTSHWSGKALRYSVREGFEPSEPVFPVQRFSKAPLSTAQPPHQNSAVGTLYPCNIGRQSKPFSMQFNLHFHAAWRHHGSEVERLYGMIKSEIWLRFRTARDTTRLRCKEIEDVGKNSSSLTQVKIPILAPLARYRRDL